MGQPATSRKVIGDALADISGSVSHPLLARRALQLAVEARPGDVLRICESIDRGQLVALPALILAWAQIIALGELGHPLKAAAISEEAFRLAAASPEAALQSVLLVVYHTEALILGGYLADACRYGHRRPHLPGLRASGFSHQNRTRPAHNRIRACTWLPGTLTDGTDAWPTLLFPNQQATLES
jgi:hypothetical protein